MLKISQSHPMFSAEKAVQEICAPFLAQHGFNYFQYARLYANGTTTCLFNNTGLIQQFIDLDYPSFSSFEEEHKPQHSYWFLWDEELPWLPVQMARECHQLHHGITLLRRSKDHYDMIAVAQPCPRRNVGSFYLTRLKAIESFIQSFEVRAKDLLSAVTKDPIILQPQNLDPNLDKILLKNKRMTVRGRLGEAHATPQELASLRLWLQGLTVKEVAQHLSLSPSTVITYLTRLKQRTGYTHKSDFHHMLSASF